MSDPTKRPLHFPNWYIPYLEKHRILELFHELARELVIQKPDDHILFIKQILKNASDSRDTSRIILLPSPKINIKDIARNMSEITGHVLITEEMLLATLGNEYNKDIQPETLARVLSFLIRAKKTQKTGWIMVGCVRTAQEAKCLLQIGVLPTHVIHFIAPFLPNINDILYCNVPEGWPEYRRNITDLKNILKKNTKEIHLGKKTMEEIVTECIELSKIRVPVKTVTPRVVLIGPRGCGRYTQAKLLVEALNLVHVNFEYLLCQAWTGETSLSEKLRACKKQVCFHSELLSQIVNKRILEDDCLKRGWVLTGYPYTVTDLKFLDSLETPPNRVIFLECDLNLCRERIRNRRIDMDSGSVVDMNVPNEDNRLLSIHPKDQEQVVDAELSFYCKEYGSLRKYCGETATVINSDQNERWVHECISAYILGANPRDGPRKGVTENFDIISMDSACGCVNVPERVMNVYTYNV